MTKSPLVKIVGVVWLFPLILIAIALLIYTTFLFSTYEAKANNLSTANNSLANSPWPRFRHDQFQTGSSPFMGPAKPTQKWAFNTGSIIFSSPVIGSDGIIYVGSLSGSLYAVNPDGSQRWAFGTGDNVFSSPAIDNNGTVYVGSQNSKLYAIRPDGSQKWAFWTGGDVNSSPAIGPDGTIYVGSLDKNLYAINPNGSQKWVFLTGGGIDSSPAIGLDGTVYIGSQDKNLYAINPDGSQKWAFLTGNSIINSSPAIGPDGTIYIGSRDNNLYAINPDGSQKWAFLTGNSITSSPAIGPDGTIYVGSLDKNLYAINPDGSQKWIFSTGKSIVMSSPAIASNGTIFIGSNDYNLYAINPDGSQQWVFPTKSYIYSSPAIGANGTIYVGSWDYSLYAIMQAPADLKITKAVIPMKITPGQIITYMLAFTNTGGLTANNVIITDILPVGITINSITNSGNLSIISSNLKIPTYTWEIADLKMGQEGHITLEGEVNVDLNPGIHLTNTSVITHSGVDADIRDNRSEAAILIIGYSQLADSPWPRFHHDQFQMGRSPYLGPTVPTLKWDYLTGYEVDASPAIGKDGTIYVGSDDGYLYAFNSDGNLKWSFNAGDMVGSPAIGVDGTIYIGSSDERYVYAVNPDGSQKWAFLTGYFVTASPAIGADGTIYVGSWDNTFYAINPDGSQKWSFPIEGGLSSAAISEDGIIYIGSYDNHLYALNPDGSMKWRYPTGDLIYASPAIGTDGTIYIGSLDDKLYAINPNGTLKWSFTSGGDLYSSPAVDTNGTVYIGSANGKLYAINPNGSQKWIFSTGGAIYSSPALDALGTIYVGSFDKNLYAVGPNGNLKWLFATDKRIYSSPAIDSDGTIYVGSKDNKIYAITEAYTDLNITTSVTPVIVLPGQSITYTLAFSNTGLITATDILITNVLPLIVNEPRVISEGNLAITEIQRSGQIFVWKVEDLAKNRNGVITITGVVSTGLQAGLTFANVVTITGITTEINKSNNYDTVNVTIGNVAPIAIEATWTISEDTVLTERFSTSDSNNDPLMHRIITPPNNGVVEISNNILGCFVYTPTTNFAGTDIFTYLVEDSHSLTDTAKVSITITAVNDPPLAVDDTYNSVEDIPLTVLTTTSILTNDFDPDGDNLTAILVSEPLTGTLVFNPTGDFIYSPPLNVTGLITFTYYISDGLTISNPAIVNITIVAKQDESKGLYLPIILK